MYNHSQFLRILEKVDKIQESRIQYICFIQYYISAASFTSGRMIVKSHNVQPLFLEKNVQYVKLSRITTVIHQRLFTHHNGLLQSSSRVTQPVFKCLLGVWYLLITWIMKWGTLCTRPKLRGFSQKTALMHLVSF